MIMAENYLPAASRTTAVMVTGIRAGTRAGTPVIPVGIRVKRAAPEGTRATRATRARPAVIRAVPMPEAATVAPVRKAKQLGQATIGTVAPVATAVPLAVPVVAAPMACTPSVERRIVKRAKPPVPPALAVQWGWEMMFPRQTLVVSVPRSKVCFRPRVPRMRAALKLFVQVPRNSQVTLRLR